MKPRAMAIRSLRLPKLESSLRSRLSWRPRCLVALVHIPIRLKHAIPWSANRSPFGYRALDLLPAFAATSRHCLLADARLGNRVRARNNRVRKWPLRIAGIRRPVDRAFRADADDIANRLHEVPAAA